MNKFHYWVASNVHHDGFRIWYFQWIYMTLRMIPFWLSFYVTNRKWYKDHGVPSMPWKLKFK